MDLNKPFEFSHERKLWGVSKVTGLAIEFDLEMMTETNQKTGDGLIIPRMLYDNPEYEYLVMMPVEYATRGKYYDGD